MTKIAWSGLGAMGARTARRLADPDHDLTVWNRTPGRADVLAAAVATLSPLDQVPPWHPHQMANACGRNLRFLVISAPTTRGDRRPCSEPPQIGEQA